MKKLFLLLLTVFTISLCASAQTSTITGTVVDATNNEPLPGASIVPVGGSGGTTTDIDGNFVIVVNSKVKELQFSYVGYTAKTEKVAPKMNVALSPSSEMLDQLVVTGYGSGKKLGSIAGSVAVVGSATIETVTTPSFLDALQGQVAGLSIMSNSGDPSSLETEVRVRGVNSLNASNAPLFILDGAPITQSVFATLNPNDIESVTVLKDAASVAIYGSRAANGVIVITSKKGKYMEKSHVTLRAKYGFSQMVSDPVEMMNSAQYIKFRDIIGQPVPQEMREAYEKWGIDTDWRKEIFDSAAPTYSIEANVTGGTEAINYYISLNHLSQEGIIESSGMRRETLRFSLQSRVNSWFRMGLQANLGYQKYQTNAESNSTYNNGSLYTSNPMMSARMALPLDSPNYYTFDENGNIVWGERSAYLHYSGLLMPWYINTWRKTYRNKATLNAMLFEQLTPVKGLTVRFQQAVDAFDYTGDGKSYAREPLVTPMGDTYGSANENGVVTGSSSRAYQRYYQFTYTNTAEYRGKIADKHNYSVLVGEESIIMKNGSFDAYSSGQTDSRTPLLQQGDDSSMDCSESLSESVMNSFFGNLSYNFDEKYFLDVNYRLDGSSRFAPGHRWGSFYSIGAMWDAKQEDFLKEVEWMSQAKLHASWGTTGNNSYSLYGYLGLIGTGGQYQGSPSIGIAQAPNDKLSWETVRGLDLGFTTEFKDAYKLDVSFYRKETANMLIDVPYSYTTGISGAIGNIASMRNLGVDIDLTAKIVNTKDWYWDVRFNMNYNKNEITKLFNGLDELVLSNAGLIYQVGRPAGQFYMVRYAGVDPRDGQQMWYTKEGNLTKVYNEERDAVAIEGKTQYAPVSGGFGTSLSWKGIQLRADFTWCGNKYMISNDRYFMENCNFATEFNQTVKMLDVWTHPGQVTDVPAPGQELQFDTHLLENSSFLRLKTLTLQYAFPRNLIKKMQLEDLKVHFTGRNLLTFTKYSGYDPEPETNLVKFWYPNTRQYEIGFDIAF